MIIWILSQTIIVMISKYFIDDLVTMARIIFLIWIIPATHDDMKDRRITSNSSKISESR